MMFSDREGCRFLCLIGEGAPRREAGVGRKYTRKGDIVEPRTPSSPRGECSGRKAELEERLRSV